MCAQLKLTYDSFWYNQIVKKCKFKNIALNLSSIDQKVNLKMGLKKFEMF